MLIVIICGGGYTGPLYYAGSADQLEACISKIESLIDSKFLDYITLVKHVSANPDAGDPDLSFRWNRCLAAIQYLDESYNGRKKNDSTASNQ